MLTDVAESSARISGLTWQKNNHFILFDAAVTRYPDKVAIFDADRSFTYQELFVRARNLADVLRVAGVDRDSAVAVCLQRSTNWVLTLLAIWELGGCYIPVDNMAPVERIRYVLDTSGASIAIIDDTTAEKFVDLASLINIERCFTESVHESASEAPIGSEVGECNRAYVIFTSGTTGYPKGVQIDHGNVTNMVMEHVRSGEIKCSDRIALCMSFGFDASIRDIVGALATGATLYITSAEELELSAFCHMLAERRISYAVVTPTLLSAIGVPPPLPDLNTIVLAGEAPSRQLIRTWGVGRLLINAYGPTEATVCATKRLYPGGVIGADEPVSIGHPTYGILAEVLDEKYAPVPKGDVGELYIGGASLTRLGYIGDAALNAQKFVDLPTIGKAYRTGDKCRLLPNNELEWVERLDDQIKINGFRIECAEVREAITTIPEVTECLVRPWRTAARTYLIAYLVMRWTRNRLSRESIAQYVKDAILRRLPAYSIPSFIIELDEIPMNINGKVDIKRLPMPTSDTTHHPPSGCNEIEAALWDVWFDVLPKDLAIGFSIDTEFHAGGGSSIEAQQILHRVAQQWHCRIPYHMFLDGRGTIRWTAQLLQAGVTKASVARSEQACESGDLSIYVKPAAPCLSIVRQESRSENPTHHFLLTGATGFLGVHLLASLVRLGVEVTCLVRSDAELSVVMRLQRTLDKYDIPLNVREEGIEIVVGDITDVDFGLSRHEFRRLSHSIDAIFHCAADVDFIKSYEQLAPTNVKGTAQILRFAAAGRIKKFNYISTLAVFFSTQAATGSSGESSSSHYSRGLFGGYAQSKWVSEQIVMDVKSQGLDVKIFRPARLWGNTQTMRHHEQDLYVRLLKLIALTGKAPDIDYSMDFTMVRNAADAMARLALVAPADFYHILDERTVHLKDLAEWVNESGHKIEMISYENWLHILNTELAAKTLGPLVSVFLDPINCHGTLFDNLLRLPRYATGVFPNDKAKQMLGNSMLFTRGDTPKEYIKRCFKAWHSQKKTTCV
ncbi:MAG: amino acid adenylation domain-containing protein [Candidatus Pacebacteria bacterium]|nr:amino acid adenylation domain-containing protein [Candidatus Paceibacterota bacterium]